MLKDVDVRDTCLRVVGRVEAGGRQGVQFSREACKEQLILEVPQRPVRGINPAHFCHRLRLAPTLFP